MAFDSILVTTLLVLALWTVVAVVIGVLIGRWFKYQDRKDD
jgi:Na+/H+-dicarboxylate symporter